MRRSIPALVAVIAMIAAAPAMAAHHQWDIVEAFSNSSGTVQFVEMLGGGDGEQAIGAWSITTGTNTLNFVTNLPSTATLGKSVLCATSNFASLAGGVTPDYIIPDNFFPIGGGTLTYASGADVWNYGAVPTDGVHSLIRAGGTAVNSPTNFSGASGSVDLGTVPGFPRWGLAALIGALLLAASGLIRRRETSLA